MKKRLLMTILSAMAVSCSQNIEHEALPIKFAPQITKSSYIDSGSSIPDQEIIGISASSAWGGIWSQQTSWLDYFANKELVNIRGNYVYLGNEFWPEQPLKFFAYYPYRQRGMVISSPNKKGYPTIDLAVPDNVDEQFDMLVGITGVMLHPPTVRLEMRHALSRIGFSMKAEGFSSPVEVLSITMTNIVARAVQGFDQNENITWSLNNTFKRNYTVSVAKGELTNVPLSIDQYKELTTPKGYMLLIPQTLASGQSEVVVRYQTDSLTQERRIALPQSVVGSTNGWDMGKVTNYQITLRN